MARPSEYSLWLTDAWRCYNRFLTYTARHAIIGFTTAEVEVSYSFLTTTSVAVVIVLLLSGPIPICLTTFLVLLWISNWSHCRVFSFSFLLHPLLTGLKLNIVYEPISFWSVKSVSTPTSSRGFRMGVNFRRNCDAATLKWAISDLGSVTACYVTSV